MDIQLSMRLYTCSYIWVFRYLGVFRCVSMRLCTYYPCAYLYVCLVHICDGVSCILVFVHHAYFCLCTMHIVVFVRVYTRNRFRKSSRTIAPLSYCGTRNVGGGLACTHFPAMVKSAKVNCLRNLDSANQCTVANHTDDSSVRFNATGPSEAQVGEFIFDESVSTDDNSVRLNATGSNTMALSSARPSAPSSAQIPLLLAYSMVAALALPGEHMLVPPGVHGDLRQDAHLHADRARPQGIRHDR